MTNIPAGKLSGPRRRRAFAELVRVQARLALRAPYGLLGIGLPVGLLVLFWIIQVFHPGSVAGSGLTILDLYIPTVLVIGYTALALAGMPATLARDREIGWLRRVGTTPIPPSLLLGAQLVLNVVIATVATALVILLGTLLFGAPLEVGLLFVGVAAFSMVEIFSLGLVVCAIAPSQQGAQAISGGLFFLMMFFSGLWIQPVQVGGFLQNLMYYSPSGAAVRAVLYSVFNTVPPTTTLLAMAGYSILFVLAAVRFFRWE